VPADPVPLHGLAMGSMDATDAPSGKHSVVPCLQLALDPAQPPPRAPLPTAAAYCIKELCSTNGSGMAVLSKDGRLGVAFNDEFGIALHDAAGTSTLPFDSEEPLLPCNAPLTAILGASARWPALPGTRVLVSLNAGTAPNPQWRVQWGTSESGGLIRVLGSSAGGKDIDPARTEAYGGHVTFVMAA
jgi:hypothetical protein